MPGIVGTLTKAFADVVMLHLPPLKGSVLFSFEKKIGDAWSYVGVETCQLK